MLGSSMNNNITRQNSINNNSNDENNEIVLPRVQMIAEGRRIRDVLNMQHSPQYRHTPPTLSGEYTPQLHSAGSGAGSSPRSAADKPTATPFAPKRKRPRPGQLRPGAQQSLDSNNVSHATPTTQDSCYGTTPYTTDVHTLSINELEQQYRTDITMGLDPVYANFLLERVGKNVLTPPKKESQFIKWFKHVFGGVFNILLWIASVLQVALYFIFPDNRDKLDLIVPIIMANVIILAGTFQWYQERHSEQIMSSFSRFIPQSVTVIRGGVTCDIHASTLVPGDIVLLTTGDKIPADVRIVECSSDMQVDNASLTGEAEPQIRSTECTNRNPMETENVAFFGTLLLKGRGKGMVYSTGDNTLLGKIANLAGGKTGVVSTFTQEVEEFVSMIAWIAVGIGLVCMLYEIYNGTQFKTVLYFGVMIIMANVPEGLLPTVTLSLALSAKRMSTRQVLVRNLEAVETLGCVSVICSDKTGTITCGTMTVSHVFSDMKTVSYQPRYLIQSSSQAMKSVMNAAILCNNAQVQEDKDETDREVVTGFPTETALFRAALPVVGGIDGAKDLRKKYPVVHEIPFNSDNKWQLSIHRYPAEMNKSGYLLLVKGAPEKVVDLCDTFMMRENVTTMTEQEANHIQNSMMHCGKLGERVLCFAQGHLDIEDPHFRFHGDHFDNANWFINECRGGKGALTFTGFMSMIDPPRPEAIKAIHNCQMAGIKVVMVTGDHYVTASAIAQQVGIIDSHATEPELFNPDSVTNAYAARNAGILVDANHRVINHVQGQPINEEKWQHSNHPRESFEIMIDQPMQHSLVVTGSQIDTIIERGNNGELEVVKLFWDTILSYHGLVFARTTPMHKMIIVEEFQKRGMIVAVTGDGVNDAPALNQANVGISMGKNGTDVAREASDIILMDDNFASIVNGIEEGRLITDNLKKSIAYTMCSKLPQLAPTIARMFLGLPLAMTMMQVILIDLGTDVWTGVAMAYEKKEDEIMRRKPRQLHKDPMVSWKMMFYSYLHVGLLQTLGCFLTYQHIMFNNGRGVTLTSLFGQDANWGTQTLFCYSDASCEWGEYVNNQHVYSHHLTIDEQKELLRRAQTGFYISLILMQISAAICSETRISSILQHGMRNFWLNLCIVFELLLGIAVVYVPTFQDWFETEPLEPMVWAVVAPFMLLLVVVEEGRKFYARTHKGWARDLLMW